MSFLRMQESPGVPHRSRGFRHKAGMTGHFPTGFLEAGSEDEVCE